MREVKRFEALSVMKIAAIGYAVLGLLEGVIFSIVFSIAPFAATLGAPKLPRFFGLMFGGLSIIFLPIFFAVAGAIGGGLSAAIYNVAARYIGGIQVEVE
jgi:hypothetical protein